MKKIIFILCFILMQSTAYAEIYDSYFQEYDDGDTDKMRTLITACADVMSFDIKDYDYDRLFKYVLFTHKNFDIITDIDSADGISGDNGVSVVSGEFIDHVMNDVFHVVPEKPPVTELVKRGYCYKDGFYMYSGGFDVFFSTEIKDILNIYDIGNNTYLVLFSDIYREGGNEKVENSYALLRNENNSYSILRLGMGEAAPSPTEVYSYKSYSYDMGISETSEIKEGILSKLVLPILLAVIGLSAIVLMRSIDLLIKMKRR